jgi:hypothetical protein
MFGVGCKAVDLALLKNYVTKSKEEKPDGLIQDKSGRIFEGRLWLKKGCFVSYYYYYLLCASVLPTWWVKISTYFNRSRFSQSHLHSST